MLDDFGLNNSRKLFLLDAISFLIAWFLSLVIRYHFNKLYYILFLYSNYIYILIAICIITLDFIVYQILKERKLYYLGLNLFDQLLVVIRNQGISFLIVIIALFAFQLSALVSRRVILYAFLLTILFDCLIREIARIITDEKKDKSNGETREDHDEYGHSNLGLSLDINNQIVRLLGKDELPEWVEDLRKDKNEDNIQHVFMIGSKGIPASYGGFETFVENITKHKKSNRILYHVSRLSSNKYRFEYNGAVCFDINVPSIGSSKAIYYDCMALKKSLSYCKRHHEIKRPIFFIMACRIGPFMKSFCRKIHKIGGRVYVNPDGHEWKRSKWNFFIRQYWKYSERLMVKYADCLVCDSKNIEKYIKEEYKKYNPSTSFIAYGSDVINYDNSDVIDLGKSTFEKWRIYNHVSKYNYYLVVGRFVPENNYETMISEFMRSHSKKQLLIVTTEDERFFAKLEHKYHFTNDKRIKFIGEIYNQDLLNHIRYFAYGYIHGHEVGGTNPSLLEALGSTKINLLLNVGFNKEVAKDGALYWTKDEGCLSSLIDATDKLTISEADELGMKAKKRIVDYYNWPNIVDEYETLFTS